MSSFWAFPKYFIIFLPKVFNSYKMFHWNILLKKISILPETFYLSVRYDSIIYFKVCLKNIFTKMEMFLKINTLVLIYSWIKQSEPQTQNINKYKCQTRGLISFIDTFMIFSLAKVFGQKNKTISSLVQTFSKYAHHKLWN